MEVVAKKTPARRTGPQLLQGKMIKHQDQDESRLQRLVPTQEYTTISTREYKRQDKGPKEEHCRRTRSAMSTYNTP